MEQHFVYITANRKGGDIYVGSTDNLIRRMSEHRSKSNDNYTRNTGIHILVYFEEHKYPGDTITRERQIKKWKREWKINLIEKSNPEWEDLYTDLKAI
ncbi:MAG TPA: GIY-YIG nuclease [Phycisphaerales bacterium]|nr:GIY-YIG nuclease [Phycisphaerales bacterium]